MVTQMMKRIRHVLTNIKSFRTFYNQKYEKLSQGDYNKYYKIVIHTIREFIIQGGYLCLPYNMGDLYVRRKDRGNLRTESGKLKDRFVDWNTTYKLRKERYPEYTPEDWKKPENKEKCLIFYNNEHTDDFVYKITHTSRNTKFNRNIIYYYFRPVEKFSRQLGKFLKQTKKLPTYYERNKFDKNGFDYGAFKRKIAADNRARKREGYRKYLHSLKENRDKN